MRSDVKESDQVYENCDQIGYFQYFLDFGETDLEIGNGASTPIAPNTPEMSRSRAVDIPTYWGVQSWPISLYRFRSKIRGKL